MLILFPQFIPSPLSPVGVPMFVLYLCAYFCFDNKIIYTVFLDSTYTSYYIIFVFLFLTSLCVTASLFIHISTNDPRKSQTVGMCVYI